MNFADTAGVGKHVPETTTIDHGAGGLGVWRTLRYGRFEFLSFLAYMAAYEFILFWFRKIDVYHDHFSARGDVVLVNNALRVLFIFYLFWIVYTPGKWLIARIAGRGSVTASRGEELAIGFMAGTGIWHVAMLALGFLNLLSWWAAVALTVPIVLLSFAHFRGSVAELSLAIKSVMTDRDVASQRNIGLRGMLLLAVAAALAALLLVKGLYPAGGHDYYTHYFHYYQAVIRHHGLWPNEVWYHFYYSKGAGLYFLSTLLTDPLAPQLVTFCLFAISAVALFRLARRISPDTDWPWVAVFLYFAFYIYTPGVGEFRDNGGWADFEKLHELNTSLIISILWLLTEAVAASGRRRIAFGAAAASATVCAILINITIAPYLGGVFGLVAMFYLLRRKWWEFLTCMALGVVAGVTMLGVFAINYGASGLINDQGILLFWQFANVERLYNWGALLLVILEHWGTTGMAANSVPLSSATIRFLTLSLRLDLLWPAVAIGLSARALQVLRRTSPSLPIQAASVTLSSGLIAYVALAIAAGRSEPISFFRYSSFIVPVVIAATVALYETEEGRMKVMPLVRQHAIPVLAGACCLWATWATFPSGRLLPILSNAASFALGRLSIDQAYVDQTAWPGRLPWGAIYPGARGAYNVVGPNVPIWSFQVHAYCMLPDCRVEYEPAFVLSRDLDEVLFGSPEQARDALKASGHNYFLFSRELSLTDFIVRAPLFAPDNIGRYLGIRWTDGTTALLTWAGPDTIPFDGDWIASYRKVVEQSPSATSFPYGAVQRVYQRLRATPHPWKTFDLPWEGNRPYEP